FAQETPPATSPPGAAPTQASAPAKPATSAPAAAPVRSAGSSQATVLPTISVTPVQLPVISVTTPPPSKAAINAAGNSVVVSPTTVPTPTYQSASSTTVITAADIESHQYRTLPDALSLVPGLNIVQTGGPGGQTSVFIRGTNSNHVKVLIDGIDVSD